MLIRPSNLKQRNQMRRILYGFDQNPPWQEYAFNRVAIRDLLAVIPFKVAKGGSLHRGSFHKSAG